MAPRDSEEPGEARIPGEAGPAAGAVSGLQVAPGARLPMQSREAVVVETGKGIVGDRYHGTRHRHVTVQSLTELGAAEAEYGASIEPLLTRRNVTLASGELTRKPGARLLLGDLELEVVRDAAPCKLLEDTLGRGAKLALHKRAGVVCRVLRGGELRVGDAARWIVRAEG